MANNHCLFNLSTADLRVSGLGWAYLYSLLV